MSKGSSYIITIGSNILPALKNIGKGCSYTLIEGFTFNDYTPHHLENVAQLVRAKD